MRFVERVSGTVVLLLDVFIVTLVLFVTFHDSWRNQVWDLANGQQLDWAMGLLKVKALVVCTTERYESFHAACMSILKNTSAHVSNIAWLLCNISRAGLPIDPPELVPHLEHLYQPACLHMQKVSQSNSITLSLVIASVVTGVLAFGLLALRLHHRLVPRYGNLYWGGLLVRIAQVGLLAACVLHFGLSIPSDLSEVFNSRIPGPDEVIYHHKPIDGGGSFGIGFIFMCILLGISFLETTSYAIWLKGSHGPRFEKYTSQQQQSVPEKSSFWSYIPHRTAAGHTTQQDITMLPNEYFYESTPLINRGEYTVTTTQTVEEHNIPPLSSSVSPYV